MEQREVAEGCSFCHTPQNTCNSCHTRHEFSVVEARKPQACATCHNGVDHNEFENYMLSKHGTVYQTRGDSWDWNARLSDAMQKGVNAPTCQFCHMEYHGAFSHNMVRKVRWAFEPMTKIAENLHHPWFENRKESWVDTCSNCHSDSFSRAYLNDIDKGVVTNLKITEDSKLVLNNLYADGLLPGQKTNHPAPPAPEKETGPGAFFNLFWQKGNNPSAVEYEFAEMWEHHKIKHYKGLAHANPGGYTYSDGWSQLIKSAARINDEDARLREFVELKAKCKGLSFTKSVACSNWRRLSSVPLSRLWEGSDAVWRRWPPNRLVPTQTSMIPKVQSFWVKIMKHERLSSVVRSAPNGSRSRGRSDHRIKRQLP